MSDVHVRDLDVMLQADFHAGINLGMTGRITGSLAPAVDSDLVTLAYFNTETTHLLGAKGDLLSHNGTLDTVLPVGAEGEMLIVRAAEATGLAWATGVTSEILNQNVTFTGPWAAGQTVYARFMRIGNLVSVFFPTLSGACTVAAAADAAAGSIPAAYRPTVAPHVLAAVFVDNVVPVVGGTMIFNIDGSMSFAPYSGAFTGAGDAAMMTTTYTYMLEIM
jgi:hypothetical protein